VQRAERRLADKATEEALQVRADLQCLVAVLSFGLWFALGARPLETRHNGWTRRLRINRLIFKVQQTETPSACM
jgi:hypothetical protein